MCGGIVGVEAESALEFALRRGPVEVVKGVIGCLFQPAVIRRERRDEDWRPENLLIKCEVTLDAD